MCGSGPSTCHPGGRSPLPWLSIAWKQTSYRVLHHASMSASLLQAADYCNWAVFRKAERADERSYSLIESSISFVFNGIGSPGPSSAE